MLKRRSSQNGLSLLECVISITILALGTMALSSLLKIYAKQIKRAEFQGEVYDLQRYVAAHFDCDKTVSTYAALCNGTTIIPLRNDSCGVTMPGSPSGDLVADRFMIRATCSSNANGYAVNFNYAQMKDNTPTVFSSHPITKEAMSWKPLFPTPFTCGRTPYVIQFGYWGAGYLNAVYGGLSRPGRDQALELASFDHLCKTLGFDGAGTPLPRGQGYSNPGNNDIVYWDNASNWWKIKSAAGNPRHFGWEKGYCSSAPVPACP